MDSFVDIGRRRDARHRRLFRERELSEIRVGYQRAGRVEDQDGTMLARPLRLDEIAEVSSLRSAARTPGTLPRKAALTVITGAPMLNER